VSADNSVDGEQRMRELMGDRMPGTCTWERAASGLDIPEGVWREQKSAVLEARNRAREQARRADAAATAAGFDSALAVSRAHP